MQIGLLEGMLTGYLCTRIGFLSSISTVIRLLVGILTRYLENGRLLKIFSRIGLSKRIFTIYFEKDRSFEHFFDKVFVYARIRIRKEFCKRFSSR